jgi:ATP adenylyltransferase
MAYIREAGQAEDAGKPLECLFCGLATQEPSPESLILERAGQSLLVMNAFPYTSGHLMVAPLRHHDSLLGDDVESRAEILAALARGRRALEASHAPHGFNLGVNLGRAAGAGVVGHIHWHLVPRWQGDTNFMPTLATTRVLPEALPDTYARLIGALHTLPEEGLRVVGRGRAS